MRAVVLYESIYGNTHVVADAIAEGLRGAGEATVLPVEDAEPATFLGADLVVVGGPTHAHGMTRSSTRAAAIDAAGKPDSGLVLDPAANKSGVRDWLGSVGSISAPIAVFDTRIDAPAALTGRASKEIAKKLRRHGCSVIAEESFLVDKASHLEPGEEQRAREWAAGLATEIRQGEPRRG